MPASAALVAIAPPDVPRLALATINLPVLATTLGVAVLVGHRVRVDSDVPGAPARSAVVADRRIAARNVRPGPDAAAERAGRRRARVRGRPRLRRRAADSQLLDAAARGPGVPDRGRLEGRVSAPGRTLPDRLPEVAGLQGAARVQRGAARSAPPCSPASTSAAHRRQSSARSRLHQLLHRRRPRSRGADVAGDLHPARQP